MWRAGRNSEIKLGQLSPEDRKKFDLSMEKEWNSWQKFGAVEKLSEEQVRQLPRDAKRLSARAGCTQIRTLSLDFGCSGVPRGPPRHQVGFPDGVTPCVQPCVLDRHHDELGDRRV